MLGMYRLTSPFTLDHQLEIFSHEGSLLLAFIVQQAEPEGQSLDLQKSTPFKLEWSPPAIHVIS